MKFRHGEPQSRRWPSSGRRVTGAGPRSPSCRRPATFKIVEFDFAKLEHRFRELAFLNSGVRLILTDARHAEHSVVELFYEGGIAAFVSYLDKSKTALIPAPVAIHGERDDIAIDVASNGTTRTTSRSSASPTTSRSATAAPISPPSAPR